MSELLKCPFCGGEAILDREDIFCDNCYLSMRIDSRLSNGEAETYEEARQQAIETWNTRTPMANIVEMLEYEKERHENDREYWSEKSWKDCCIYNEYDMADRKIDCYDDAINIVKQEINNGLE